MNLQFAIHCGPLKMKFTICHTFWPDGLTLTPWSHGKSQLWDATCGDTLAKSYVNHTSKEVGWVARTAEEDKIKLYSSLRNQLLFCSSRIRNARTMGTTLHEVNISFG